MKNRINISLVSSAIFFALCLGTISCAINNGPKNMATADDSTKAANPPQTQSDSQKSDSEKRDLEKPDLEKQRQEAERQAHPDVEKERKQAADDADKTLDKDAVAAITQTQSAIDAIASNKTDQALQAIEQATGKINVLLARNPVTALIPVAVHVEVIDTAPHDTKIIKELANQVSLAVSAKDYPAARVVLDGLTSEIRVRTYSLPLATYPEALTEAARLLDQKKNDDASNVLLTALNTLLAVDRVTPLPLVLARGALNTAKTKSQSDKAMAQTLVQTAKNEIERAKQLGYTAQAPEYAALNADVSNLEKQLKGNGDSGSVFAKLDDKLSAFLKRQSQRERR